MYYEEQWINEKLCFRSTPNGVWQPFTIGQYKDKVRQLEQEIIKLNAPAVSNRRELLLAFHKFQQKMWSNPNAEISENVVDVFLSQQ